MTPVDSDTDVSAPMQIAMHWLKEQPIIGTLLALMFAEDSEQ